MFMHYVVNLLASFALLLVNFVLLLVSLALLLVNFALLLVNLGFTHELNTLLPPMIGNA